MTRTKQIITQHKPSGTIHYLSRQDLERRLEFHQRLNLHLARLNRYLAARLAEVRA